MWITHGTGRTGLYREILIHVTYISSVNYDKKVAGAVDYSDITEMADDGSEKVREAMGSLHTLNSGKYILWY